MEMRPPDPKYARFRSAMQRRRDRERAFRPIALEIGRLVYEWNRLHAALGLVFWRVSGTKEMSTALAIWHSTTQDLPQRKMLSAALSGALSHHLLPSGDAFIELEWMLGQINKLGEKRNDAIYSPLAFGIDLEKGTWEVFADWTFGHGRAQRLKDKHLLNEITWYRRCARDFANYTETIYFSLAHPKLEPWPERPVLPTLGQRSDRPRPTHRSRPKSHRRRSRLQHR